MRIELRRLSCAAGLAIAAGLWSAAALAHDVAQGDKAFVEATQGAAFIPFLYLGAKHMVTGYDHILFLIGVVMFLYRLKDVILYVSMFTIGHSATLLLGVLVGFGVNGHLVDAIIGLSIMFKGFENLGGFQKLGLAINTKLAVLIFGLFHGLGLAAKLMDLSLSRNGLVTNLIGFNIGVEVGQILVLFLVVNMLNLWRGRPSFRSGAGIANGMLIMCGLVITIHQATGLLER